MSYRKQIFLFLSLVLCATSAFSMKKRPERSMKIKTDVGAIWFTGEIRGSAEIHGPFILCEPRFFKTDYLPLEALSTEELIEVRKKSRIAYDKYGAKSEYMEGKLSEANELSQFGFEFSRYKAFSCHQADGEKKEASGVEKKIKKLEDEFRRVNSLKKDDDVCDFILQQTREMMDRLREKNKKYGIQRGESFRKLIIATHILNERLKSGKIKKGDEEQEVRLELSKKVGIWKTWEMIKDMRGLHAELSEKDDDKESDDDGSGGDVPFDENVFNF